MVVIFHYGLIEVLFIAFRTDLDIIGFRVVLVFVKMLIIFLLA
jgi:hypothetical protein